MSGVGERDDAPEFEEVVDAEIEGADGANPDEGNPDDLGGDEADQPEPEGTEDTSGDHAGQAGQPGEVKPRSAATIAVQEAKRRAKEAEAETVRLRAEMAEIQRQRVATQTAEERRLEAERLALMSPEEKSEHQLKRLEEGFNARIGALQFQTADSADRTAFETRCARVPAFDAIRDDVEAALAKARAGGSNPSRETVAKYLIGERAIERAEKGGKTKQANRGQQNVQRQTVKPSSGRSDVQRGNQRSGGSEAAARAARLENQQI